MAGCQSSASHSTVVVPVLFFKLRKWTSDQQGENVHCCHIFVTVAIIMALEVLQATRSGRRLSVGVVVFLLAPLQALAKQPSDALSTLLQSDLMRGAEGFCALRIDCEVCLCITSPLLCLVDM